MLDPDFVQNWPIILNRWPTVCPLRCGRPLSPAGRIAIPWRGAIRIRAARRNGRCGKPGLRRPETACATWTPASPRTAQVTLDPLRYRAQLLDLAVDRFDIWTERGLTVVSTEQTRRDYEHWLAAYVTNWLHYVADTCPRVDAATELRARLRERAAQRALQAQRRVAP